MAEKVKKFDESMKRLENIVTALESGSLPLEDTVKLYEEGTLLAAACSKALDSAEQKITDISEKKQ